MNTSQFVNSFEEIRELNSDDQLEILEQARMAAFSKLNLAGRAAFYLLLTIVTAFIFAAGATALTGLVFMPVWVGVGVWVSLLLYQRLMKGLLRQGLASVLESRDL